MRLTAVPERLHYLADRRNHPALIRRRDPDALQEMRLACFGDVHAGMIPRTAGNLGAAPRWQSRCGFHPCNQR